MPEAQCQDYRAAMSNCASWVDFGCPWHIPAKSCADAYKHRSMLTGRCSERSEGFLAEGLLFWVNAALARGLKTLGDPGQAVGTCRGTIACLREPARRVQAELRASAATMARRHQFPQHQAVSTSQMNPPQETSRRATACPRPQRVRAQLIQWCPRLGLLPRACRASTSVRGQVWMGAVWANMWSRCLLLHVPFATGADLPEGGGEAKPASP